MKSIQEVLEANGYEMFEGYQLGYDKDRDYDNVFISREQVVEFYNKPPVKSYWNELESEMLLEELDAWERLYENWCDKNLTEDQDLSFEDWEKEMLK